MAENLPIAMRPLSTHVTISRDGSVVQESTLPEDTIGIEVRWNGRHTVTSRLSRIGNDWTPDPARPQLGACTIGDMSQEAATLDEFLRCVAEFEQDPFHHPLWTG